MAEFFVSYNKSDRATALLIVDELRRLGHVPRDHELEIRGGDIYDWMEKAFETADHAVCVVSLAYLNASYSSAERRAALWQEAKRPGFALFVLVEPVEMPKLSAAHHRCELYGLPEAEQRKRLARFFPAGPYAAGEADNGALSNIPVRVPLHFIGREDSLEAVAAALDAHAGRVAITAVHGLRGVGKTTLAAAFADRWKHAYHATWWIRAQSADGMRADLVALGVRLGWVAPDEKEAPAYEKVAERLRREGAGLLLIFDNAMDVGSVEPFLPLGGAARVLVTSNAHAWRKIAAPLELRLWPKETGADYFLVRLGGGARASAEALSQALGGLPLAHEQAAAFCERLGVSLADYRRRFEAEPIRLLDAEKDAPAEYHDKLTVAKTFALAIREAGKLHPAAAPLIAAAAPLPPEPIPLFLFADGREELGEPLGSALAGDGLEEALAALRTFALVDLEDAPDERDASVMTKCFRLHRLVRIVAGTQVDGEARAAALSGLIDATVAAMAASGHPQDARAWPRLRRLEATATALIDASAADDVRVGYICTQLATLRQFSFADYARARPLFERSMAIYEKALGPDHSYTATSLNNLGALLRAQGDLAAARPLYERALAICEKALGPDHNETAMSLNNLGFLLQAQGDVAGAGPLYERALAIREKALGPDHPDTAQGLNNLGVLLRAQGDFAGARPLLQRALAIREKALGPDHPDTASSLNNLGALLLAQGDLAGARRLLERAQAIREKALGPDHPDTALSLNDLGFLLHAQGDLTGARPLLECAMAIWEKALGPRHPWTQAAVGNLAATLDSLGRADEAAGVRAEHGV